MDGLPRDLPSIAKAKLPVAYESAKTALAECTRLDECKDWADRAEALASYAKQAQDDELRKMADRIQARAIRRCGELLNQIKAAHGANQNIGPGEPTKVETRADVARSAGLTRHQHHTAVRVARVPEPDFDHAVESQEPPTVTALAERGTIHTGHLNGRNPEDFRQATALLGLLKYIDRIGTPIDTASAVRGLSDREIDEAIAALTIAERWLGDVAAALGE